jgi:Mg-chelatase subunit ChlD
MLWIGIVALLWAAGCGGESPIDPDPSEDDSSPADAEPTGNAGPDAMTTDGGETPMGVDAGRDGGGGEKDGSQIGTWTDQDDDGHLDRFDNCWRTPNPDQKDSDNDNVGDKCDNCPEIPNQPQRDDNNNGTGNVCEPGEDPAEDSDGDGLKNAEDNCPTKANKEQKDKDDDGVGNVCDNCPDLANSAQKDDNDNGTGNACEEDPTVVDSDGDNYVDANDNCPNTANEKQKDTDGDLVGDACDNCKKVANFDQKDSNNDGTGDACTDVYNPERDQDKDGVPDIDDNCPTIKNKDQKDPDNDRLGNPCDNCDKVANYLQEDSNNDGIGDACTRKPVGNICKRKSQQFKRLKPNIFIVLDKSGSMEGTKMRKAKRALDSIANQLHTEARFGLLAFESGSCPANFKVLLNMGSYGANRIKNSYRNVRGDGGTNLGHALAQVRRDKLYLEKGNPNSGNRTKVVIAISDGRSSDSSQCRPEDAANRMRTNAGVNTYTIGFTSGADKGQLDRIAQNGGTNSSYTANNRSQLVNALKQIASKAISCKYQLNPPSGKELAGNKMWVRVGGSLIARSEYSFDSNTDTLSLSNQACQRLNNLPASHPNPIEIQAGCKGSCQNKSKEICNYKDDDCDGKIDELDCGSPEICGDGKDNDLDNKVDEGCPDTQCEERNPEICDGEDNDCDGQVDEGCDKNDCTPTRETCDGKDNDCDGDVDEGCPNCQSAGQSCGQGQPSCCSGECRSDGTCGPKCRPAEVNCREDEECCSGVCQGGGGGNVGTCIQG